MTPVPDALQGVCHDKGTCVSDHCGENTRQICKDWWCMLMTEDDQAQRMHSFNLKP